jgi:hypothetical protein
VTPEQVASWFKSQFTEAANQVEAARRNYRRAVASHAAIVAEDPADETPLEGMTAEQLAEQAKAAKVQSEFAVLTQWMGLQRTVAAHAVLVAERDRLAKPE